MKIINNSLEHSYETEKGSLLWWESNPMPLVCQKSTLDIRGFPNLSQITDHFMLHSCHKGEKQMNIVYSNQYNNQYQNQSKIVAHI